ncbi:hypothetical protein C8R43DRAFT_1120069 [Mycena crocata]|nr:hypothetical protein C8R43DRAFT_1120069 [Mycena crocata]
MKDNFVWIVSYIWLAKVYSNSFLASLNARNGIREAGKHGVFLSGRSVSKNNTGQNTASSPRFAMQVNIETDTFVLEERPNAQKYPSFTTTDA